MEESMRKVSSYGSWTTYGGLIVMVASILTFFVEFMRMFHIARLQGIAGQGHADVEMLESKLDELERQNQEQADSSNLFQKLSTDMENEKAALMGNKESVLFVYMINCVICVIFFIQGILMWQAAKPTIETIEYLKKGGVDNVPADLMRHTRVEAFLVQRGKFKYCLFASLFNAILICLSTFLRMVITFDTYQKEEKILLSYKAVQNRYAGQAEADAA